VPPRLKAQRRRQPVTASTRACTPLAIRWMGWVGTVSDVAMAGVVIVGERGVLSSRRRSLRGAPRDEPSWLPVACAGCGQRWYGIDRAHCGTCHRTFTDVEFFDRHRVDDGCRSPASLDMIKNAKSGVWERRAPAAKRRRAG
jgi:hypothetical protein